MTTDSVADGGSFTEAAAVGALGAVFASAVGAPVGLAVPFGVVGAANGVITGWRQVYDWGCANGLLAFTLDSTWSIPMTAAGLAISAPKA